jgi:hypothetical protein
VFIKTTFQDWTMEMQVLKFLLELINLYHADICSKKTFFYLYLLGNLNSICGKLHMFSLDCQRHGNTCFFSLHIINCMVHSLPLTPSWSRNSQLLWNLKGLCNVQKIPPLDPILS